MLCGNGTMFHQWGKVIAFSNYLTVLELFSPWIEASKLVGFLYHIQITLRQDWGQITRMQTAEEQGSLPSSLLPIPLPPSLLLAVIPSPFPFLCSSFPPFDTSKCMWYASGKFTFLLTTWPHCNHTLMTLRSTQFTVHRIVLGVFPLPTNPSQSSTKWIS